MKNLKTMLATLAATMMLTACSDDAEPDAPSVYRRVIDFENTNITLAGPTSYGDNLYADYSGRRFVSGSIELEKGVDFEFGINADPTTGDYNFWNGGMVLSQWNYRSVKSTQVDVDADWWMSYLNQCSVYNTASIDGSNKGAGADGSNTFALINGYSDQFNDKSASFSFSAGREYLVENMMICPTSYVYGTVTKGNPYGNVPGQTLKDARGWVKVTATGYDAAGTKTATVEKYLCDYRNIGSAIEIASTWQLWDLSAMGRVNKVVFNFEGSDTGQWGLNTPAYLALDNITIRMN